MSFTLLFLLGSVFFGPPSRALVVITWRGVGCRYMMRLGYSVKKGATTENQDADVKYMG